MYVHVIVGSICERICELWGMERPSELVSVCFGSGMVSSAHLLWSNAPWDKGGMGEELGEAALHPSFASKIRWLTFLSVSTCSCPSLKILKNFKSLAWWFQHSWKTVWWGIAVQNPPDLFNPSWILIEPRWKCGVQPCTACRGHL